MKGEFWIADSRETLSDVITHIEAEWEIYHWLQIQIKNGRLRTTRQNSALHAFFREVAKKLNAAGITWEQFFKRFDFPFSEYVVKENIWRPVQLAVTGKESTTELERAEVSEIYDHVNSKLSEHGIHVPLGRP